MSSSVDSGASKKDGAPIRSATDRAQDGDARAFWTEGALLRLEEGLRAQREQLAPSDQPLKPDGATGLRRDNEGGAFRSRTRPSPSPEPHTFGEAEKRTGDWLTASAQIEAISQSPPLAPAAWQPKIRAAVPLPSWHWRKVGFVLCALFLVVGAAALKLSLKAPTTAPINIEARGSIKAPGPPAAGVQTVEPAEPSRTASVASNNDEPGQPLTNAVKSSAATPSLPPLSQPVEAQVAAKPVDSETGALAETPVERKAKGARTKSRAQHARSGR